MPLIQTREIAHFQRRTGVTDDQLDHMLAKAADIVSDLQSLAYPPVMAMLVVELSYFMAGHMAKMSPQDQANIHAENLNEIFGMARDYVSLMMDETGAALDDPGSGAPIVPFN